MPALAAAFFTTSLSADAAENSSFSNRRSRQPAVNRGLETQSGTGTVRMCAA
jgi:hypothetical protein